MIQSYGKSILTSIAVLLALLSGSPDTSAQSQIKGTVYDTDKTLPLVGASVVVEGKNAASITDVDGKFSINAKEGDVLSVQFMGYFSQKVTVG